MVYVHVSSILHVCVPCAKVYVCEDCRYRVCVCVCDIYSTHTHTHTHT